MAHAPRHPFSRLAYAFAWPCLLVLSGCQAQHRQSVLHPDSRAAEAIASLWWVMFAVLAASFIFVIALLAVAIRRSPAQADGEAASRRRTRWLVFGGGMAFPGVILLGLLFYSLGTSMALRRPAVGMEIVVTGHQWWWDIRYPEFGIASANEIYFPAGEPVVITLRAADVIHSFWVPNLHGKIDVLPEVETRIVLEADRPGVWRGQCAEFCGRQHAWMAFKVVALSREAFDAWVETRRSPPRPDASPLLSRGEQVFFEASCHTCHAIAGTPAQATLGPDLTHIGSRLTLGAGRIENTDEHLARWLLNPQDLKPGNLMPETPLSPDEVNALVAYLRALQ